MSMVVSSYASAAAVALLAGSTLAAPVNTTLAPGMSWQSLGTSTYDTGLKGTERGGSNGQTSGPYNDTSYGVMNEGGTPWYTGNDLSAQQYVQKQIFGNFGTSSPPGPAGARYYNGGNQGTNPGTNFPNTTSEQRKLTLNQWNNTNPDAGGVAALNQIIYVPVSATLTIGAGYGGDEMLMKAIGGNGGQKSKFTIDASVSATYSTAGFGGKISVGNIIALNAQTEVFDPGSLGNYDVSYGLGVGLTAGQNFNNTSGSVKRNGNTVSGVTQGIPANSIGTSFSDTFNVLGSILQDGSGVTFTYTSAAVVNIARDYGNADARASMGPGMEGTARLVVQYEAFQAIPTPGAAALMGLGTLVIGRRRR